MDIDSTSSIPSPPSSPESPRFQPQAQLSSSGETGTAPASASDAGSSAGASASGTAGTTAAAMSQTIRRDRPTRPVPRHIAGSSTNGRGTRSSGFPTLRGTGQGASSNSSSGGGKGNSGKRAMKRDGDHNMSDSDDETIMGYPSRSTSPEESKPLGGIGPAPEWKYDMRRLSQPVLKGLLLGPYQAGKDLTLMKKAGVTHVLIIGEERESPLLRPRFPNDFVYKELDMRDAHDQNVIRLLPEAREFIDQARKAGGTVLVYCMDGISRSPAIVTAYVMVTENVGYEEAFNHVQSRRFCVSPNAGFHHQIEAYEHINKAAMISAADPFAGKGQQRTNKKRIMEMDEDDEKDKDQVQRHPTWGPQNSFGRTLASLPSNAAFNHNSSLKPIPSVLRTSPPTSFPNNSNGNNTTTTTSTSMTTVGGSTGAGAAPVPATSQGDVTMG